MIPSGTGFAPGFFFWYLNWNTYIYYETLRASVLQWLGKNYGLMIINMIHLSSYFRSKIFTITKLHKTYFNDQILSYLNSVRLGQARMRDRIWLASVSVRFETCRQTFFKPDTDFRNINRQTSSSSRPLNNNNNKNSFIFVTCWFSNTKLKYESK